MPSSGVRRTDDRGSPESRRAQGGTVAPPWFRPRLTTVDDGGSRWIDEAAIRRQTPPQRRRPRRRSARRVAGCSRAAVARRGDAHGIGHAIDTESALWDGARADSQFLEAPCPERAVPMAGQADGRHTGANPCGSGAGPAVMRHRGDLGEQPFVRSLADGQHVVADDVETRPPGLHDGAYASPLCRSTNDVRNPFGP